MTKEQLLFILETRDYFEFTYNNKTYSLSIDKSQNGKQIINFGHTYEEEKYDSLGALFNSATIENHFFKDLLEDL